jgi:hypothetical protein
MKDEEKMRKIVEIGKKFVESECPKWKKRVGFLAFNCLISALFLTTGLGHKFEERRFEKLTEIAGGKKKIPKFLKSLNDDELLNLALELRFREDRFLNGVKGILDLDDKYDLQRDTLTHIKNPEEFYKSLKKISGFGGGEIGRWVGCEFVRTWKLKIPRNLELPKSTEDCLKDDPIKLDPKRFAIEDYPYVDAFFEKPANGERLRILKRENQKAYKREVERLLKDP